MFSQLGLRIVHRLSRQDLKDLNTRKKPVRSIHTNLMNSITIPSYFAMFSDLSTLQTNLIKGITFPFLSTMFSSQIYQLFEG